MTDEEAKFRRDMEMKHRELEDALEAQRNLVAKMQEQMLTALSMLMIPLYVLLRPPPL